MPDPLGDNQQQPSVDQGGETAERRGQPGPAEIFFDSLAEPRRDRTCSKVDAPRQGENAEHQDELQHRDFEELARQRDLARLVQPIRKGQIFEQTYLSAKISAVLSTPLRG